MLTGTVLLWSLPMLAGCSGASDRSAQAHVRHERNTMEAERADAAEAIAAAPRGATILPAGFATILDAPPRPYDDQPPPAVPQGEGPAEAIARALGISVREASDRVNPDGAARQAARELERRLRSGARGNFVTVAIERDPLPHFTFYFRRDAAPTLARFTRDPRFRAREGGVPREELQPIFEEWRRRFEPDRLFGGGGIDERNGVVRFDMDIDEAGFREVSARNGWRLPARLELEFSPPRNPRSVDPGLARFVRVFAREDRRPASVLQALLGGRVILRDGCFRLADPGQAGEPLILFGRDTELALDGDGYMVVRQPGATTPSPRVGEMMLWSGPRGVDERDEGLRELRARCGSGPVTAVGEPESAHAFRIRPWAVDSYATAGRITREEAWRRIKACFAQEDARLARGGPDAARPPRECDSIHVDGTPPPPPA